jgi:hypothetical protein
MKPVRDPDASPRASSSPLLWRRDGGVAAPAAILAVSLLALAAAGRVEACDTTVRNNYNVSLTLASYNGDDGSFIIPYDAYGVDPYGGGTYKCAALLSL